ncbi:MAG: cell division protein FtsA [Maricaulaceae bacterium]
MPAQRPASRLGGDAGGLQTVTALDLGVSKVFCIIARASADDFGVRKARVLGVGSAMSRGIKLGGVADMEAAEASVRAALDQAEATAQVSVSRAAVVYSGPRLRSRRVRAEVGVTGREIATRDIRRALDEGLASAQESGFAVLHAIPLSYAVDGADGVRDPRRMIGARLGVDLLAVSAPLAPLRQIALLMERCHLELAAMASAPYLSGLSSLTDDEVQLGVTLVDMGAGATAAAVFEDGVLRGVEAAPLGGRHVSNDLARALAAPPAAAERIKTLYASVLDSPDDDREMIDYERIGEDGALEPASTARSLLVSVARPRLEETFELIRDRLAEIGDKAGVARPVVLTGGASRLNGARELAQRVFGRPVRLGRALRPAPLSAFEPGPGAEAAAGLVRHMLETTREARFGPPDLSDAPGPKTAPPGAMGRALAWLRENF